MVVSQLAMDNRLQSQHGRNVVSSAYSLAWPDPISASETTPRTSYRSRDHRAPKKWRNGEEAEWLFSESKFLKPESLVELVKVAQIGWKDRLSVPEAELSTSLHGQD